MKLRTKTLIFFVWECGFELRPKTAILCLHIALTNVVTLHTGKIKKYIYLVFMCFLTGPRMK